MSVAILKETKPVLRQHDRCIADAIYLDVFTLGTNMEVVLPQGHPALRSGKKIAKITLIYWPED